MEAAALTREMALRITPIITGIAAPVPIFESTSVTLTTGQSGSLYFPHSSSHWANDNNTITRVADENPFPTQLHGGATIDLANTAANSHANDRFGLKVYYDLIRKVA